MDNLPSQVQALITSLDGLGSKEGVSRQVGTLANVLIAEAKKASPDNPVIHAVEPFELGQTLVRHENAGSVRTIMQQVLFAL